MIKELGYIPSQKKNRENPYDKCNFSYNKLKDEYICPEKKPLIFFKEQYDKTKKKIIRNYKGVNCGDCLKQKDCTKTKNGIRIVKMFPYEEERQVLEDKMQTPEAKQIYNLRRQIVEPVFGDMRENKGVMSFLTRSLETVKTEFNLICTANNIRRIYKKGIVQ